MSVAKKSNILNQAVLALVFTLSFVIYFAPELSISLQFIPLVVFAALVFCRALTSDSLITALTTLVDVDGLLYVAFLSLLMVACSLSSAYEDALRFALLLSACLVLSRIYMTLVPIREVLEAFYWSAIVSMFIFVPLSFEVLVQSATTLKRLDAFNFHPGGLALQLAAYLCVMVWKFSTGGWFSKALCSTLGFVSIVIIFIASSRGTIVGLLGGCAFLISIVFIKALKQDRKRTLRLSGLLLALLTALCLLVNHLQWTQDAYEAVDQILSLSTPDRGLNSGMTGRVDVWHEVLRIVGDGSWVIGHGVRSSDAVLWPFSRSIDNSYLVILYDMGIVPLILITWRFVSLLRRATQSCLRAAHDDEKLWLACGMFLVLLLVSSIIDRSLFAVGNPFSLLAFLFFTAPNRVLMFENDKSSVGTNSALWAPVN